MMELIDLLSIDAWVELEKRIHSETGMDCNIFNADGYRITGFKEWVNRICPVIKDSDRGQSYICAVAHMNLAAMAEKQKKTIIEACDAGMVKLVVPVIYGNTFLGAFGACGLLMDDGVVDAFMVNRTIGLDESEIENLSNDIPYRSTDALIAVGQEIEKEIDRVVLRVKQASK